MGGRSNYYRRLLSGLCRNPRKLPALWRLQRGGEQRRAKAWLREDGAAPPPITLAVRQTYRCNLRCRQCGQWGEQGVLLGKEHELAEAEIGVDEIKRFLEQVAHFRPYIYLTGGEPLLRGDVAELIRHAARLGLLSGMSTNGTLLAERAREIVGSGLDYCYVSLDAPDASNSEIRRGADSSARAVRGIEQLLAARAAARSPLPLLQVQTIIVKENCGKLYEMAEFVEQCGADVWGLQLCVFTTPDQNAATEEIYRKEFGIEAEYWRGFINDFGTAPDCRQLEDELRRIRARRWRFKLRLYSPLARPGFSFEVYFRQPEIPLAGWPCLYPFAFVQLQPNGDLACCGSQPDYVLGNIREASFGEIWNGARARAFRKYIRTAPLPSCSRCFGRFVFEKYRA